MNQNPTVKKLTICGYNYVNISSANLMRIANERPALIELKLWLFRITPDDAAGFARQMKSLNKFQFQLNDRSEYDQLVNQLDSEWKHEYANSFEQIQSNQ